jgi:O-antigen ligase
VSATETTPQPQDEVASYSWSFARRLLVPLLLVNVVAMPLLVPRGPNNTAIPDAVMIPLVVFGIAALWRSRAYMNFPLGASYFLILIGGLLALSQTIVVKLSSLAVAQDAYLFIWFVVVANILRDGNGRTARLVARAWVIVSTVTAAFVYFAHLTAPKNIPSLFGFPISSTFGRASGTFRDPNLAGNYIVVSLFVMWASPWPAKTRTKLFLSIPFVLGAWATLSITALAVLVGGTLVALSTRVFARRSIGMGLLFGLVAIFLVVVALLPSDLAVRFGGVSKGIEKSGAFGGSLGRTGSSAGPRIARIKEAFDYFGDRMLLGIGPAATDRSLAAVGAPLSGEIHNDYAAGFLERGIIGGIGVLMLVSIVFARAVKTGMDPRLRDDGWRPAALTGAVVACLMSGFSLETLHFRHVWLLFALVIGLRLAMRSPPVLVDRDPTSMASV